MARLFGTDGVRGIANVDLTPELTYKLGRAGAYVLSQETKHIPKILIGMDTRISGHMLKSALVSGICSIGAEAVVLGVVPTPAVAYLIRRHKADGGIVISASHNPFEFNGIKFFNKMGYKLSDSLEDRIENIVLQNQEELPNISGEKIGIETVKDCLVEDYLYHVKNSIDVDLNGLKVAMDCANGSAYKVGPEILKRLGCSVFVTENQPNGININDECGSTYIDKISEFTRQTKADIGIAFDGDADRLLACDELGNLIDGDKILSILGLQMKKEGKLIKDTIVSTIMANTGFGLMAASQGINIIKTNVGDRYVLEEMLKGGYVLGGEQSGHIIFLEYNTTGDGIITALQLLKMLKKTGKKASELAAIMEIFPQILINARVNNNNKYRFHEDEIIAEKCKQLEIEFYNKGRILIRASGTEPLIRVMIEGKDHDLITVRARELVNIIEERLG